MKPRSPPLQPARLWVQPQEWVRYLHYGLSIEKGYLYWVWVRFFIRWKGVRHPRDMGALEVESFLFMQQKRIPSVPIKDEAHERVAR